MPKQTTEQRKAIERVQSEYEEKLKEVTNIRKGCLSLHDTDTNCAACQWNAAMDRVLAAFGIKSEETN